MNIKPTKNLPYILRFKDTETVQHITTDGYILHVAEYATPNDHQPGSYIGISPEHVVLVQGCIGMPATGNTVGGFPFDTVPDATLPDLNAIMTNDERISDICIDPKLITKALKLLPDGPVIFSTGCEGCILTAESGNESVYITSMR